MRKRIRRTLIGALLAAAVTATVGLTITASRADHINYWNCAGGGWQSVCAQLRENSTHSYIWARAKARYLSTGPGFRYQLTVRLEECLDDGSGCDTVGYSYDTRSGVDQFTVQTSWYHKPGGVYCYKSKANLYRMRADGTRDWIVGDTQSWC